MNSNVGLRATIRGKERLKMFWRLVEAVSRTGPELRLEPSPEGLLLSAASTAGADAAFTIALLRGSFFVAHGPASANSSQATSQASSLDSNTPIIYKVSAKSFGSLKKDSAEVESMELRLSPRDCRLRLRLSIANGGAVKEVSLPLLEGEALEAPIDKTATIHSLTTSADSLGACLGAVGGEGRAANLSLELTPNELRVAKFLSHTELRNSARSEYTLPAAELEDLDVAGDGIRLILSQTDLRAVVTAATALKSSIRLLFRRPTEPVILALDDFSADARLDYLLASKTLETNAPPGSSTSSSSQASEAPVASQAVEPSQPNGVAQSPAGEQPLVKKSRRAFLGLSQACFHTQSLRPQGTLVEETAPSQFPDKSATPPASPLV